METRVRELAAALRARDARAFDRAFSELLEHADALPPSERDGVVRALAPLVRGDDPELAARAALVAGALVESGASAALLAELVIEPIERWLAEAAREAQELADAAERGTDAVDDPLSGPALTSLDTWYRPAVAAWTRAPGVLTDAAARPRLREGLDELREGSKGAFWMWMLMSATRGERFVVLVPADRTAYAMTLDGVVDMGQLTILASHALPDAFAAIGAPPADDAVLATMRGEGPQLGRGGYSGNVHFHPWRALDPASGQPVDGRFTWTAPGGSGTHSLPADFLPTAIEPLEGHRVLALVGPKAGGTQFTRVLGRSRVFAGLRARIEDVEPLGRAGFDHWLDRIRRA